MPKEIPPPHVELDELLAAEYDYIAQTAIQAHDDRSRVSSFYLIAVGSLIAALLGTQLFDPEKFTQSVKFGFSGAFVLLTILGASTVMQLARLRAAWHESMMAMNQIKDFAMDQSPELTQAFRWKTSTLPDKYKKGSVSYYQAREVAIIGGLMFGAAVFFLQMAFFEIHFWNWLVTVAAGIGMMNLELNLYKRALK
jgi:hypothetical protein